MDVSSGEDNVTKKLTGNDVGDGGASSAEPVAPSPIMSDALGQIDPSVADRVASTAPPIGGRRHKRPPPIPKQKRALNSSDQVMIQIELPPYRGPCSPLDLVSIEIIFGCILKHFNTYLRMLVLVLQLTLIFHLRRRRASLR
jgi:hypothetical protein